jgi:glycolate oxidase
VILRHCFSSIVGPENILIDEKDKMYASIDQSNGLNRIVPMMVIKVSSQKELVACVQACLKNKTPIVIRAAGSGKSGGAIPSPNCVVIDISKFNKIIDIDKANLLAHVEPGLVLSSFKHTVEAKNLFYPPDPASQNFCTLGGNVAENAAGPSTLKYGSTRDYVLGGKAIIGTGEIIEFGKLCPKGVAGYDITSLLCGSEGTLAVFLRLTLRLLPKPQSLSMGVFYFNDELSALLAIERILLGGCRPRALEYIDKVCLSALKAYLNIDLPDHAYVLIIECDSMTACGAQQELYDIRKILHPLSAHVEIVTNEGGINTWWQRRSLLSKACDAYLGYKISEDIAIPLGKIKNFRENIKILDQNSHLLIGLFGHAGDGNLHVQIMFDSLKHAHMAIKISKKILLLVVGLGGTIAAEHGIGLKKKTYLPLEQSLALIELQKRIKLAFDPYNLLNPGKIFDLSSL